MTFSAFLFSPYAKWQKVLSTEMINHEQIQVKEGNPQPRRTWKKEGKKRSKEGKMRKKGKKKKRERNEEISRKEEERDENREQRKSKQNAIWNFELVYANLSKGFLTYITFQKD